GDQPAASINGALRSTAGRLGAARGSFLGHRQADLAAQVSEARIRPEALEEGVCIQGSKSGVPVLPRAVEPLEGLLPVVAQCIRSGDVVRMYVAESIDEGLERRIRRRSIRPDLARKPESSDAGQPRRYRFGGGKSRTGVAAQNLDVCQVGGSLV